MTENSTINFFFDIVGLLAGLKVLSTLSAKGAVTLYCLDRTLAAIKKVGLKPFYIGLSASLMMGVVSFLLIKLLNIGTLSLP